MQVRAFSNTFDATVKLHARNHARLVLAAKRRDSEQTKQEMREAIQKAIADAHKICQGKDWYPCAVAWDIVDELSAAEVKAAKARDEDPPEDYQDYQDNPESEKYRVYDS